VVTSPEGTDEAVEAAARAVQAHLSARTGITRIPLMKQHAIRVEAKVALAAAAPYVAAKALRDAVHAAPPYVGDHGGYLLDEDWLLARADEIERAARAAGKDGTDG
jgi:hypothetical protein